MTSEKVNKIVEMIKELTVLEAFELKKTLEEVFDVKAPTGMPIMMNGTTTDQQNSIGNNAEDEKTEFDVLLVDAGSNKIGVIKVVKNVTGLGLKEAKDLVDSVSPGQPKPIKEGIKKEDAEKLKKEIENEGGKVEIK